MRVLIELFSIVTNFEPTRLLSDKLMKLIIDFNFTIYAMCIYWFGKIIALPALSLTFYPTSHWQWRRIGDSLLR
jgi:hypothetical protein